MEPLTRLHWPTASTHKGEGLSLCGCSVTVTNYMKRNNLQEVTLAHSLRGQPVMVGTCGGRSHSWPWWRGCRAACSHLSRSSCSGGFLVFLIGFSPSPWLMGQCHPHSGSVFLPQVIISGNILTAAQRCVPWVILTVSLLLVRMSHHSRVRVQSVTHSHFLQSLSYDRGQTFCPMPSKCLRPLY